MRYQCVAPALKNLKSGGIIIFDNYLGKIGKKRNKIFYRGETNIIDKFLKKKRKKVKFFKLFVRPSYIIK